MSANSGATAAAATAEETTAAAVATITETMSEARQLIGAKEVKEFYGNDIVFSYDKKKGIVFGVVVDSYESSGSEDSLGALEKGQIRVYWPHNHSEHVWKQDNVHLLSRFILPGDIVRRLEDGKETQRGYCRSSKQVATVQILGTDKVIENVSQDRLENMLKFNYGSAVCLNNKFGRIMNFDQKVTLTSKCGSVVEILNSINHDIEEYWLGRRGSSFVGEYYVGQDVSLVPWNLEEPTWIKKSKTIRRNLHMRQKFTVKNVEIVNVDVAWHRPDATSAEESKLHMSIADVKAEEIPKLQLMESMEERSLELCERRLLKLSPGDTMITKKQWLQKRSKVLMPHLTKGTANTGSTKKKRSRYNSNSLLNTDDEIYVMGADDVEEDTEAADDEASDEAEWSTDNESSIADDKQRMLVVFKKKRCGMKKVTLERILNVPVEVTCYDSQVTIVWQDGTEEKDLSSTQLYYSISLDDHEFFPGEWVIQNEDEFSGQYGVVQKVDYLERTAMIKWFEYNEQEKEQKYLHTDEMSVYDITKHPKFAFRPGIFVYSSNNINAKLGMVHDSCPQGYIVVKWLSGDEGKYTPQELVLLPDTHDLLDDDDDDENESGQMSWETESIESITGDMNSEPILQNMAARLDFVRSRIVYLREAFQQHTVYENFTYLRDLLIVYDNSSYLDKLLGTSFFNNKSKHYQTLLQQVKDRARQHGVEIFGRCVSDNSTSLKMKVAERENINKVLRLEHKINAQIESSKDGSSNKEGGEPSLAPTPESEKINITSDNLCVEVLSMIKARMDLAYAEIVARMDGTQALTVMTKASEPTVSPMLSVPTTPDDSFTSLTLTPPKFGSLAKPTGSNFVSESYSVLDDAPTNHRYFNSKNEPTDKMQFFRAVRTESNLLRESLPPGVWVRSYANRMDLLSVMIRGPDKTPYEDGLFLFDMQLSADYPRSPPLVSYISYSSERLNPNLYVEGRVCVSLLGTWLGRGTEVWGPNSTLLQLIVSIQGLILVAEPYYNEAGYEKQSESQQGYENSRTYNELVILKLVQSMTELLLSPPQVFRHEVLYHFSNCGDRLCVRLKALINNTSPESMKLDFPLLPISKGLKLSLNTALDRFHQVLISALEKQQPIAQTPTF
ncbi:PREDICTED: (E3-independent) E2 ubiquitin-conjugating enzyme [Nicrophorus vespilloides]|uniref:(E3-independent) E2 ubiquitin-conjugating enzyme n=1 Tax=Nicrophorus vespilloides TaxID=110193 RepID=A0ABM1N431_NICVS|nr:PREDICTED: (E3-independent) E2 ubiquitin-conjugating enzyme [Nicrophorus vespilloides]